MTNSPRRATTSRLGKGDGYFYVYGGEESEWLDRVIRVPKVSSLTLEQWIGEIEKLHKLHREYTPLMLIPSSRWADGSPNWCGR